MKKQKNLFIAGMAALALVFTFVLAGCGGGGGGGPTGTITDPAPSTFSASGNFAGGKVSIQTSSSRAVTDNSYIITGEIEYTAASHVLKLVGNYDPKTKEITASAAKGDYRYLVIGNKDSLTVIVAHNAGGNNWTTTELEVTPAAVTINGAVASDTAGAFPNKALGWWTCDDYYVKGNKAYAVVSPFSYKLTEPEFDPIDVQVVWLQQSGSNYDVVVYYKGEFNGDDYEVIQKMQVKFTSNDTKMEFRFYMDRDQDGNYLESFETVSDAIASTTLFNLNMIPAEYRADYGDGYLTFHR